MGEKKLILDKFYDLNNNSSARCQIVPDNLNQTENERLIFL